MEGRSTPFLEGGGAANQSHRMAIRKSIERQSRPLHVDVNDQNPGAVKFYEAMGFETIGRSAVDGDGRPFPLLHMRERI